MLVAIGERWSWADAQTFAHLPTGWSILYQLAHLERATFEELLRQGVIHPRLKLWQARKLVAQCQGKPVGVTSSKARVRERMRRVLEFFGYPVPGWDPEGRGFDTERGGWGKKVEFWGC